MSGRDGGGGASRYEGTPSYQSGLGVTNRGAPDVSYDANPNTGFAVYDSYGGNGWAEYGGTSAGAPQWAALIAIADQGRALAGKGSLSNAQDALYSLSRSDFHDITTGSNGTAAKSGYDLASGLGSPIANLVIRDFVAYSGSTSFRVAAATNTTGAGDSSLSLAVALADSIRVRATGHRSRRRQSRRIATTKLNRCPIATRERIR